MVLVFPQAEVSSSLCVIVTVLQVSEPVASPVFVLDSSSEHSIVTSAGIDKLGAVVSWIVIV